MDEADNKFIEAAIAASAIIVTYKVRHFAKTDLNKYGWGVSLNSYINATLAATVAQAETLAMMGDRLSNIDREELHARVMYFMTKTKLMMQTKCPDNTFAHITICQ